MTEESINESVIADSVDKSDGHQVLNNRNGTLDRGLNTQKRVFVVEEACESCLS